MSEDNIHEEVKMGDGAISIQIGGKPESNLAPDDYQGGIQIGGSGAVVSLQDGGEGVEVKELNTLNTHINHFFNLWRQISRHAFQFFARFFLVIKVDLCSRNPQIGDVPGIVEI